MICSELAVMAHAHNQRAGAHPGIVDLQGFQQDAKVFIQGPAGAADQQRWPLGQPLRTA